MHIWKKGYDSTPIIASIKDSIIKVGKDGVQFKAFLVEENETVLASMLDLPHAPDHQKMIIVREAISTAAKKNKVNKEGIEHEIEKSYSAYLQKPLKMFVVVSEISLAHPLPAKVRKINNETIIFNQKLPKRFLEERKRVLSRSETVVRGKSPQNYPFAKTITQARDIYKAYEQAEDSLDLLRGIWNYILSPGTSFRLSFNKRDPVNKIILGPLRTLHEPSGKAATTIYYCQDSYFTSIKKLSFKDDEISRFKLVEKDIRQALKKCTYANLLCKAIIRYTRALDDTNWHSAFLSLWGVLEQLTGSGFDSYKVTIRRATFLYKDIDYHTQVLLHLKEFRNSNVHTGETKSDIEKYMYQLKGYVELLMKYHLFHTNRLDDFDSAIAVLDLPPNEQSLRKRDLILQAGIKFKT